MSNTGNMIVESERDIEGLKRAGAAVSLALAAMKAAVRPGITPLELDEIGARILEEMGARSAPKLAYNFPSATCISVGDACAHGIADDTPLADGVMLNIDVSAECDGYWADMGASMVAGTVRPEQLRLLQATRHAQYTAMMSVYAGARINLIGKMVERVADHAGYRIAPELNGHGVGRSIHQDPTIPNWYDPDDQRTLKKGQVITVEPFLTPGSGEIYTDNDGWTLRTRDGAPMAQFEHTFIITERHPIIVTTMPD